MGPFHEVMPTFEGRPIIGKRLLKVISVTFFPEKIRFDGPAMASRPITPTHNGLRSQRLPGQPGPVRFVGAVGIHPGFVTQCHMDASGLRLARFAPLTALYTSPALHEIVSRLEYAAERQWFAVVTGDCGTGKSTTIRRLHARLDRTQYQVLYLADSKLAPRYFYKGLLEQLGCEAKYFGCGSAGGTVFRNARS